jgi:hypothetical protein
MLTIQHLEVRFDVEGGDDEQAFVRLFQKYIERWARAQEEGAARRRQSDGDRALGDEPGGGEA